MGAEDDTLPAERARASFEKLVSAAAPSVDDALVCVKAQNEALNTARNPDRPLLRYRKAICYLIAGIRSYEPHYFEQSADSLADLRTKDGSAPLLAAVSAIAQLRDGRAEIDSSVIDGLRRAAAEKCLSAGFIGITSCQSIVEASQLWLGYFALREGHAEDAAKDFAVVPGSPWNAWLDGMRASQAKNWTEAAPQMEKAVSSWNQQEKSGNRSLADWLGPKPVHAETYARLGIAQFMAGEDAAAIQTLDVAITERPRESYLFLLRARARENLGLRQAAIKDYEGAAAAGAGSTFYQGLLSLRAGEFSRAGEELTAAGDKPLGDVPATDVDAWRALAQAAGGSCLLSPDRVEALAAGASRAFPQEELTNTALQCRLKQAATLEQLLALDPAMRAQFGAKPPREIAGRIAEAYTQMGVQAEDKKDAYMAVIAYRRALEWDPASTKTRFNLAAVYIGDLKFDLAEQQYRALLAADPADHESQYWLAQSIIAQRQGDVRKAEACDFFQRSLTVQEADKRTQFAAAMKAAGCPI
jgi:Tfp pilus assembly protein PilF